ncbi:hypothetical protein LAZ67_19000797 [Cordylochernes scorpioides]|uniref:RNA-directed DNA polymerase n=1 Tax=Cordylochernes scorpioides TaxID=51811 RepID=A0ABY6LM21_9ARAC|nr:hypothetical protein LAZ67_19000797 [Cordylochernes scorpioides]
MASFGNIENFDPSKPEKWTTYVERMILFFLANGIEKITQKKAIFLTLIGPETYALARSLAAPKDLAHVNYEEIVNILTGHFCPRPNLIVQRYHFNKHNQGNEPIATYIAELRRLSENCEFVDLDDRLRDRLVCGLKKESLVKRLLSEKDLTFEKAMDIALCDESASANASVLMETTPDVNILKKANKGEPFYFKSKQPEFNRIAKGLNKKIICIRCKGNHLPHVCKFRNSKCFKCEKIGHLQKACLTRVKKFGYLNRSNSDTYLHCLGTESLSNPFYIMVKLDNHDVAMLIDSGSAYSLLNKETFLKYWRVTQLEKSEVLLKTWSSSNVKILGKLFVKAKVTNGFKKLSILVADGLGPNILGRQWFEAFRLRINFLNHIETNPFSSEFEEVFKQEIDAYNGPLIHIDIPENAEPKFVKARTVPFALRELVDKKLKSLEEQGVVEPVKFTKWASPIVTVLKNDGTIRICHDYKSTVNLYSNPDKYPLPTIPQLLDRLRGGRVFTKLDMAQAYQQLKVDETSAEILAINTPRGLYKVKRLPFGLNSAVGTFQRFMDTLLSGIDGVAVYLDDVLISGRDCDDLKRKTEKVLLRFRESGLRLKKEKCHFYVPEIEFLGMIIDHKGIHPSEEKLRAIKDARPPSNKRELMSFLGLNYYERFLNNKATVAEPLHRLLDSNSPWKWNKEHQRSFAEVKNLISSKSVLAHFNEDLPILVNCDASEYGVGAILSQIDHGVERPVVFASRTLNKTERRYAYLLGRKFKILTDHKPLVGIFNPKKPIPQVLSPRMLRWCLTLAAYTYSIEYKPGKVNCNADALSRLPLNECPSVVPNPSEVFFIESEHAAINSSEVAKLTNKDPILSKVKFWAMNGWPERKVDDKFRDFVSKSSEISVHKDYLLWGSRVIIPERLRKDILNLLHDTHIGIVGTKALARGLCWWPKMDGDIERMISSCSVCLSCSHDPPKTDVYPWIWPSRPWSRLHIDHAGSFQGKIFLVVVDAYSKWIEAKIVSTTSTETTINCLKEIFATHGLADVIVSDNGTSFTSEPFRTFLKRNGVRHILCAPYHAASNGQVERAIQTLKNLLRKNSSGNWTTRLSRSLLSMRIAINSTTQKSPAQLLMNRNLKSLINKFHPEGVSEGRMRQEDRFIRNWKPHRVVNEGQAVIARGYHGPRWLPGVVREKTGPVSIKVETNDGEIVNRHLDQVRSCGESEALPSTSSTPQVTPDFERPPAVQETDSSEGTPRPVLRRSLRIRKPPSASSSTALMANAYENKPNMKGKVTKSNENFQKTRETRECYFCHRKGHLAKDCRYAKQKKLKEKEKDETKLKLNSKLSESLISERFNEQDEDIWIGDSGATNHITRNASFYTSYKDFPTQQTIKVGSNEKLIAYGSGTITIETCVKGKWQTHYLTDVWYVPNFSRNVMSLQSTLDKGFEMKMDKKGCKLFKTTTGEVIVEGKRLPGGLYGMLITSIKPENAAEVNLAKTQNVNMLQLWHERFGHQNKRHVQKWLKEQGIDAVMDNEPCEACIYGKQHRLSFGSREQYASTQPGSLIHVDVCGSMQEVSKGGMRYFVCFKDDFTKYRSVYFLKEKSQVIEKLEQFLLETKTTGHIVKEILTDGGKEFVNKETSKITNKYGINHRITMPYTPQQNGSAERENRTLIEAARSMIYAKNMSLKLWAEAVNTATYVLKRTGQTQIEGKTPYELWFDKKPAVDHLQIFGTECFVHVPDEKRRKLDAKSEKGILVGYCSNKDGYRIWMPNSNKVVTSRDVIFKETIPTFSLDIEKRNKELSSNQIDEQNDAQDIEKIESNVQTSDVYNLRDRSNISKPQRYIDAEINIAEGLEPKTYKEAMDSPNAQFWKEAMNEEMNSLTENDVYECTTLPPGQKPIDCKWVLKTKLNSKGEITRYKARLVAKGFAQKKGIDYEETFSPVARHDTIRTLLAIAANEDLKLVQFDIKTAFLYGDLQDQIYIKQPEGFNNGTDLVWKLKKSLYRLKQSPRCWNQKIVNFMKERCLKESTADPCLFFRKTNDHLLIIAIYVDDGIIAGTNEQEIKEFLDELMFSFKITSEPLNYFLGIEIERQPDESIFINQKAYIKRILEKFNMSQANKVGTPTDNSTVPGEAEILENVPFREAIGSLMHLSCLTKPDITFALNKVSQKLAAPTKYDWEAVKRIFKYLVGTTEYGIMYQKGHKVGVLESFSDADFAGDPETRRSTSGVVCKLAGGAISWLSQKQRSVSLSTTEAELVAASNTAKEVIWLNRLFSEISPLKEQPIIKVDNASTIKLIKNPEFHKRTKHIEVRHYFVREKYQEGIFNVEHISGKDQVADIMTKGLPKPRFQMLRYLLENKLRVAPDQVKALLLVDNSPAHPTELISNDGNIKCKFLPPNTTSVLQPMDQGVIVAFKRLYKRRQLESCLVFSSDADQPNNSVGEQTFSNLKKYDIKKAIFNFGNSWDELKSSTIRNVWKILLEHKNNSDLETAGDALQLSEDESDEDEQEIRRLEQLFQRARIEVNQESINEWIDIDLDDPGHNVLSNDDIVEAVLSEKMKISSSDDSSSTSEDSLEPDVPRCEALKSLDVALKYLEKRTEPEMLASTENPSKQQQATRHAKTQQSARVPDHQAEGAVYQLTKMEGHILVGLSSVKLADKLIEGLDIEDATLRAFPLRKRAERVMLGNVLFGENAKFVVPLRQYGQIPALLDVKSKGVVTHVYMTYGIKCSLCFKQEHKPPPPAVAVAANPPPSDTVRIEETIDLTPKSKNQSEPQVPESSQERRTMAEIQMDVTNIRFLDDEGDLCHGYSAVVAPAMTTVGSGLDCVFTPGVVVHQLQILWPGKIVVVDLRKFGRFRGWSPILSADNPGLETSALQNCKCTPSLAEHCNFGMLHDELIRDRIVVGVRDRALSERMQLDTDLTLVKATLMAKQLESVKEQQSSLYQQDSIDQIKKMPNHIKETKRHEPKIRQFKSNQLGGSSHGCTRCGNSNNHDWKNCPAMNSYCSKCKKKGHYAKVCRSEAINEIKSEIAFLGSVEDNSKKWIVPIKVNNRQINFKIDTGADVNVLPLQYYYQSFQRIKLEKSDKILQGPNGIPLETVGMIHVKLQNKGQHLNSKIYIVDKLKQPLLSGETSEKLNIVRMIQQLSSGGRGGQRGRLGSGDNRGCYNCGEEGHRKFECTKPVRGGGRGRGQSRDGGSNNTCYNCGEVGHRKYECTNNTAEDGGQEENQRKSKKARYTCGEFGHKKDDCPKSGTQESGDEEESSDNKEEETPQKRKQAEDSEEEEVEAEEPPKKKSKKPKFKKKIAI